MNRRSFLSSMLAACAAPAIVRADSLMRIVPRETSVVAYRVGDLTERALEDAMIEILRVTDDRGRLLNLMPTKILVHPENLWAAHAIVFPTGLKVESANLTSRDSWYLEAR